MNEYIVTVFKVVVGLVTSERLAICACIIYGVLLTWIFLSLIFSFQSRFSKNCKMISRFIDENGLSSETYPKFIELATRLPDSFLRGWKTFEHSDKGLPSEYIKRAECLDLELSGGLFNQNRSVMKGYIGFFTAFITLLCLALAGTKDALTGYLFAEALILPFTFCVICMLTYFLYAAIRQHQYKMCVEDFNEMLDILNEKVECGEVEFDSRSINDSSFMREVVNPATNALKFIDEDVENIKSDIEASEYFQSITADKEKKDVSNIEEQKVLIDDHTPVVGSDLNIKDQSKESEFIKKPQVNTSEPLEKIQNEEYTLRESEELSMEEKKNEVKRGRGRPKKEKVLEGELVIKTDKEFEEALARAEKLMKKNEEPLSQSQQKRVEKALKELVDAMKKYKEEN